MGEPMAFGAWNPDDPDTDGVSGHDFTVCDCAECHAALLALQDELDELERTDPDVRAAAESYDRMVERITGRTLPRCDDV